MNKRNLLIAGSAATFSLALLAIPGTSAKTQNPDAAKIARLQQPIEELKVQRSAPRTFVLDEVEQLQDAPNFEMDAMNMVMDEEGSSWLRGEAREVAPDGAKELKLPAEHGVVLGKIIPDSPADKAGLHGND